MTKRSGGDARPRREMANQAFLICGRVSVALATYSSTMRTASGSPARVPLASSFWGSIRLVSLSARSSLIPWVELLPIASIASASWWSQICSWPSSAWWPLHFLSHLSLSTRSSQQMCSSVLPVGFTCPRITRYFPFSFGSHRYRTLTLILSLPHTSTECGGTHAERRVTDPVP